MPKDPESLGTGIGPLLADFIPLLPSGARRAGAARVMAARVGRDPSVLVTDPIKTQLIALGLGAIAGNYAKNQSTPVRVGAAAAPILLTQMLRRMELKSIQGDYDNEKRTRLRDLDQEKLFDAGWFGGSSRLGAANAYETMRKRKYRNFGSLAEAGDAIQLAAGTLHPALYAGSIPLISGIDNREADKILKKADFSEQRNSPSIPLYLAAALASSAGLGAATALTKHELGNTPPLDHGQWSPLVERISGGRPLVFSSEGMNNAAFVHPPRDDRDARRMMRYLDGFKSLESPTGMKPQYEQQALLNRLKRYGAIVADSKSGAPAIAHEAGHAKIENSPGILRLLQRHLYPHSQLLAPLAGAGSMAAGLASGSTLKGALLGTLIGGAAGAGTVGPEVGASYHGLKGLGRGALTGEGGKDLLAAISTYLAATVLPSTLAGAAGGYISGRRRKREEESPDDDIPEKSASARRLLQISKALRHIKETGMSGDLADSYARGQFGTNWTPLLRGFFKNPEITALGITQRTKPKTIEELLKGLQPAPTVPTPPPVTGPPVQQTFDFLKNAHAALPSLIQAKKHSDSRRYVDKNLLLKMEMRRDPGSFLIDSDDGKGIVGVTHVPTGFRIHMLKHQIPQGMLTQQKSAKAAPGSILKSIQGALGKLPGELRNRRIIGQNPLFGERLAAKANNEGVTLRTVADGAWDVNGDGIPFERLLRSKNVNALHQTQRNPKNPGVFIDFGGAGPDALGGKNFLGRRTSKLEQLAGDIGKSKYREYQELPSLVPETVKLNQFAREQGLHPRNSAALHDALQKRFGQYIMKLDESAASSADSLHTDLKGAEGLRAALRGVSSKDYVVQPRIDLAPLDRPGRMINQTGQLLFDGRIKELANVLSPNADKRREAASLWRAVAGGKADYPMQFSLTGGKGKEYRVHVLNGKVIPYATNERGTLRGLIPWRTGNHRKAEAAVQEQIDAMPAAERAKLRGGYGFDAMKGRQGGWHIVETNPSEVGGGSGFVATHPAIQDAIAAAVQGRLPRYIKAQRAITGGAFGGAGLTLANASGASSAS